MTNLKKGDKAPDFCGTNQDGNKICSDDYKGKKLALYFYPKDNTPGCTTEACSLRDSYDALLARGYNILGVSPNSEKSHKKFIAEHNLPFPLAADTEHKIAEAYGVWGEKKMYGKTYFGIFRTTFVIGTDGMIEEVIANVDTVNHADQLP